MLGRLDLQDADVVEDVPADDARLDPVAVPELDVDGLAGSGVSRVASPAVVITCEFVRM